jgi:hypothetical protein
MTEPLALELAVCGKLDLPVTVPEAGRISVTAEDGTAIPVAVDRQPAQFALFFS